VIHLLKQAHPGVNQDVSAGDRTDKLGSIETVDYYSVKKQANKK
jgi:hypothetical protein